MRYNHLTDDLWREGRLHSAFLDSVRAAGRVDRLIGKGELLLQPVAGGSLLHQIRNVIWRERFFAADDLEHVR